MVYSFMSVGAVWGKTPVVVPVSLLMFKLVYSESLT
jgi:hypothetical protein